MMKFLQSLVGATAVAVLFFGGVAAAHAAHTPVSGPVAGGTTVTVEAPASPTFIELSTGAFHSVAVGPNSKTYAWGSNGTGQLGNGTTTSSSVPVEVLAPAGVTFTHVSAGTNHSVAVGSDGKSYAWGYNYNGQLGNGTTTDSLVPVEVSTPAGVTFTHVSTNHYYSVAVGSNGKTYAWGQNGGQLGNGTSTNSLLPVEVLAPAGVTFTQVSAGRSHSVAVGSNGKTYAWGQNGMGQLGNGNENTANSSVPVEVLAPAGVTFTHISADDFHSVAVGSDGKTYAWGFNGYGQLGNGATTNSFVPVEVLAPAGVIFTHISTGNSYSVAVGSDGKTYAWGYNDDGQLGNVTTTDSSVPVEVSTPAGVIFTHVSAGDSHSVAVGSDGKTYAWGNNYNGQLGNGTTTNSSVPVEVSTPAAVATEVSFGGVPGTGLTSNPDGTWSVITPAHAPGPVDVVVSWTVGGVPQTPVTTPAGFTYTEAPTIITTPADQTVVDGTTAVFEVATAGFPTPAVSWEVSPDGVTWEDAATDPTVTIAADGLNASVAVTLALNGYQYRATATNDQGTAVSDPAVLTVTPALAVPTITNPVDQGVVDGATAVFGVTATGFPAPVVSWEVSSDDGSTWQDAATDSAVTVAAAGLNASVAAELAFNGYQYRATATNDQGTAVSTPAVLTVTPAPTVPTIEGPVGRTVVDGTAASFEVTVTGLPAPVVTWEVSSDDGSTWEDAATDPTVTIAADGLNASVAATLALDGYQYRATATNDQGTAVSDPAVLTVTKKSGTTPPKPGTETPKPGTETPKPGTETSKPGASLARTGSSDTTPIWWAAAGMLALGAALIAGRSRRTRNTRDQAQN